MGRYNIMQDGVIKFILFFSGIAASVSFIVSARFRTAEKCQWIRTRAKYMDEASRW
jgi:hypothetical protein